MQEGPVEKIYTIREKVCTGCKFLHTVEGVDPDILYFCSSEKNKETRNGVVFKKDNTELSFIGPGIKTPDWCPYL